MTNNIPAYIVVECRPSTEEDGYADIVIHNDTYIFESVEPAENLRAAMLIAIDIERTKPNHKHQRKAQTLKIITRTRRPPLQ